VRDGRRGGFNLLEVLAALAILQVGLLGVIGLFALAAHRLTRALLVERAVAEVAAVADSLSGAGASLSGESLRGDWRIVWRADRGGLAVRALLGGRPNEGPMVEVDVP
jgi:hypothetical protein